MLTVNELFSGIGTQAYALEYLGVPHKIVGTAEILSSAIKAYNSGHGETMNYGDISKISSLNYADLWTYSFPCFTGDTLILTSDGLKRIDEVQVGMQVYSHRGELRDVLNVFDNGKHLIVDMYIDGIDVIHTTSNHKFLVLQRGLLEWVSCDEIEIGSFLCVLRKGTDAYGIKDKNSDGLPTFNSTAAKNFKDLFVFKRVNKIDFTDRVEQVYDIEVDVDHSFIANGVVAHNCQDLSSGGKGKGIAAVDENGEPVATRSGLLWQVERLLAESRGYEIKEGLLICKPNWDESLDTAPKYLLLENVPELITRKKHKIHFDKWLQRLDELGYNSFYGVLNGADFGVPQNRERVFCLSVRKDVYSGEIYFPSITSIYEPPKRVGFENFVDKKVLEYSGPLMIDPAISSYLRPAYERDLESIAACSEDTLNGKEIWTCECKSGFQDHRVGLKSAPTIRHQNTHTAIFVNNQIHKLTACECWKFMGIKEEDFWKVKNDTGLSDSIMCGLAGNAIVVPVLMSLFNQIWRIELGLEPYPENEVPFLTTNDSLNN